MKLNPDNPLFHRFYRRLNWRQKLWLFAGYALVTRKERAVRICNPHGPLIDMVRGFEPNQRQGDCPCCNAEWMAKHRQRLAPRLVAQS